MAGKMLCWPREACPVLVNLILFISAWMHFRSIRLPAAHFHANPFGARDQFCCAVPRTPGGQIDCSDARVQLRWRSHLRLTLNSLPTLSQLDWPASDLVHSLVPLWLPRSKNLYTLELSCTDFALPIQKLLSSHLALKKWLGGIVQ